MKMYSEIMKKAGERLLLALSLLILVSVIASAQERATPYIYALYNPVVIAPDQTSGNVTLVWDGGKDHPYAEVWVRVDENDETFIVEQGKGTRRSTVEFGKHYVFKLSDSNVLLAQVSVTVERGDVSAQPTPAPMTAPDYQPLYAVNGKIRWKKAFGVVPVSSSLQDSIDNRCISFYVAALDPRTNQPLRGDHSQMWKADDEGDYYVCRYA